ncbi:unnamed protein product [Effrenium voratum]|nr:unnamed protein product [Effrenium voratum]
MVCRGALQWQVRHKTALFLLKCCTCNWWTWRLKLKGCTGYFARQRRTICRKHGTALSFLPEPPSHVLDTEYGIKITALPAGLRKMTKKERELADERAPDYLDSDNELMKTTSPARPRAKRLAGPCVCTCVVFCLMPGLVSGPCAKKREPKSA